MVRAIEPAAPEPVQITARRILHGAEEIRRLRALEPPAPGIFAEGEVEQLAPQHRFAQHGQRRRNLGVTGLAAIEIGIRLGHDRALIGARQPLGQRMRRAAQIGRIFLPLPHGQLVEE